MSEPIRNRYEFVLLFDVKDGNPNGDPDAGNLPRMDPETGHGLVTDVCLKRKVRNYVQIVKNEAPGMKIFVKEKAILNRLIDEAHEHESVKSQEKIGDKTEAARQWMCENYYDIRTFGAVMNMGKNAGQVRGPVQLTFARSKHRIFSAEHALTICAARREDKPIETQVGIQGRKFTVPYALYETHGYVSAPLANQTGFSEEDLELFWEALVNMFDHDRSAARGEMASRKLIVFKHASELGNAPAQRLFELVTVEKNCGDAPPRSFGDYTVSIDRQAVPDGVEIIEKI